MAIQPLRLHFGRVFAAEQRLSYLSVNPLKLILLTAGNQPCSPFPKVRSRGGESQRGEQLAPLTVILTCGKAVCNSDASL